MTARGSLGHGMASPGRIPLVELIPSDGLPKDRYKLAVSVLSQSLARYSMAVVQLPPGDDILLKCVLDSSRMYFHHKPVSGPEDVHAEDLQNWHRTVGYYSQPEHFREFFDFRPGRISSETNPGTELPPVGLPELFSCLGRASRYILEAIGWSLDLRSFAFADLLDNVPLKNGEISTSVLCVSCHGRPCMQGVQQFAMNSSDEERGPLPQFDSPEPYADKSLLTVMRSDQPGLQIRDAHGRWLLADGELRPNEVVVYAGLSLHQATAGYVSPALLRTEICQTNAEQIYGRCSVAFKLMPKATAILHSSSMATAGHVVGDIFQQPVAVNEFMQRSPPMDQIFSRPGIANCYFPAVNEGSPKVLEKRKQVSKGKPLAPSKRLRSEAQRVLKERVQEIADKKGLKLRFCNFKDCEKNHSTTSDSPCVTMRQDLGWPKGVPFAHPHDLPNKAKQAFLEAFEPGWTCFQDGELGLIKSALSHSRH